MIANDVWKARTSRAGQKAFRLISAGGMSLGVAALMMNTACYSYNARSIAELHEGDAVSVAITPTGRQLLSPKVGDSVAVLRGKYVSDDVAGVRVNLTDAQFLSGMSAPRDGIDLTIPRTAYDSVSTRKLAIASTAWVVLGAIAGVFILAKGINLGGHGTDRPTPPPVKVPGQG